MATTTTNGRTTWILWLAGLVTTILFAWMTGLTNNVIANDQLSRARDEKINECIYILQNEVLQRLTRIETKVETLK